MSIADFILGAGRLGLLTLRSALLAVVALTWLQEWLVGLLAELLLLSSLPEMSFRLNDSSGTTVGSQGQTHKVGPLGKEG